jgi:hypothetical protein
MQLATTASSIIFIVTATVAIATVIIIIVVVVTLGFWNRLFLPFLFVPALVLAVVRFRFLEVFVA